MLLAQKTEMSRSRIKFWIWHSVVFLVIVLSAIFLLVGVRRESEKIRMRLGRDVYRLSRALNPNLFLPGPVDTDERYQPEYATLSRNLNDMLLVTPLWDACYIVRRDAENHYVIMIHAPRPVGTERARVIIPYGTKLKYVNSALTECFDQQRQVSARAYKNEYGTWHSAYMPIANSATGNTMAVIGVDLSDSTYRRILWRRMGPSILLCVIVLLIVIAGWTVSRYWTGKIATGRININGIVTALLGLCCTIALVRLTYSVVDKNMDIEFSALSNRDARTVLDIVRDWHDLTPPQTLAQERRFARSVLTLARNKEIDRCNQIAIDFSSIVDSDPRTLASNNADSNVSFNPLDFMNPDNAMVHIYPCFAFGKTYLIITRPTAQFLAAYHNWGLPCMVGGISTILTLAFAVAISLLTHRDERLQQQLRSQEHSISTIRHETERRIHVIIDTLRDTIWELDLNLRRFTYISPSIFETLGYTPSEYIGLDNPATGVFPEDRVSIRQQFLNLANNHPPQYCMRSIFNMRHKDGHAVTLESVFSADRNASDGHIIIRGTSRDITQQRRIQCYQLAASSILQTLSRKEELNTLLQEIVLFLQHELNMTAVGIRLKSGDEYPYVACMGFPCEITNNCPNLYENTGDGECTLGCVCGAILSELEAAHFPHTVNGSRWSNDLEADLRDTVKKDAPVSCVFAGFRSMAISPIRVNGEIVGLIQLASQENHVFSIPILQQLESIAAHISHTIIRKRVEQDYRLLFQTMTESVFVLNGVDDAADSCVIQDANPAFMELLASAIPDSDRVIGMSLKTLLPLSHTVIMADLRECAAMGHGHFTGIDLSEINRKVELAVFKITAAQYACVLTDVTAREAAAMERENLQAQLLQANKMESIGRLAGGIAHDFNNLLQPILTYAEMASMTLGKGAPAYEDIDSILAATRRATSLTRQLLIFSRRSATPSQHAMNLNAALADTVNLLRHISGVPNFVYDIPDEPCYTLMDSNRFDQIITNLCVNARDAINGVKHGSIRIYAGRTTFHSPTQMLSGTLPSGDYAVVEVTDNGCGIADDVRQRLFDPFFTTKPKGKGTGLGLSVVYGIVQNAHGGIDVASESGIATTFSVYLPITEAPPESPTDDIIADSGTLDAPSHATILLVDDEAPILNSTASMLRSFGYTVHIAQDAKTALQLAENYRNDLDLIISDVIMPDLSGPQLVQRVITLIPDIAILYISGYTDNLFSEYGIDTNKTPLLSKPFDRVKLAYMVHHIIAGEPV